MIQPGWLGGALALISLISAGVLATAAFTPADRAACLAHAAMSLGMAGMFSPWGDPVPGPVGAVVFAVLGAWFAARRLRSGVRGGEDALHLVVGPVAMIVMYLAMDHDPDTRMTEGSGHAGHGSGAAVGGSVPLAVAALVLGAYFVWHTWHTATRTGEAATRRWSPVRMAHVVMSALMAAMLLAAL